MTTAAASKSTFLFGIGAPKSGTSWLFDALLPSPDVYVKCLKRGDKSTAIKETHYFDWVGPGHRKTIKNQEAALQKQLTSVLSHDSGAQKAKRAVQLAQRLERLATFYGPKDNHEGYLNWLTRDYDGEKLLMDFTPAYGLLSAKQLAAMANIWPDTKFVFIMRDPIDRLWSSVRYQLRFAMRNGKLAEADFDKAADDSLMRRLGVDGLNTKPNRCNYIWTVNNVDSVIAPENALFLFYEDLFTEATYRKILSFVGIDAEIPDFGTPKNVSRESDISPELEKRAFEVLRPQYDFAHARFGDALPDRWGQRLKAFA